MKHENGKSELQKLFEEQVADIYYAEKHILKALPKMQKAANGADLASAFKAHIKETEGHVSRLESVFEILGKSPRSKKCEAIEGLIKEGEEIMKDFKSSEAIDAALIAAAQKIEHYEIATYGTLASIAEDLGLEQAARQLGATLAEEKDADQKLSSIARSANPAAAM